MDFKKYIKKKFGKDIFSISEENIIEERVRIEKEIENISTDIKNIQKTIERLMIESKGQPKALKLLNIQKIKALKVESNTKQQHAMNFIKKMELLYLVEAMKEDEKIDEKSELVQKIINSDMDKINEILMDTSIQKSLEDGKIDNVKEKLEKTFGKEANVIDSETQELMNAIEDLENVDMDTALHMAKEKAKELSGEKKRLEDEDKE
ncbi:MAG: hypothetical protein JW716_01295 [Candidatus Aenigmarchaeota archaeon]|nr:hypothetical protein [Candidatus Aenigmarchaeota archaeon]